MARLSYPCREGLKASAILSFLRTELSLTSCMTLVLDDFVVNCHFTSLSLPHPHDMDVVRISVGCEV